MNSICAARFLPPKFPSSAWPSRPNPLVPGCATGATHVEDVDDVVRFLVGSRKEFTAGRCTSLTKLNLRFSRVCTARLNASRQPAILPLPNPFIGCFAMTHPKTLAVIRVFLQPIKSRLKNRQDRESSTAFRPAPIASPTSPKASPMRDCQDCVDRIVEQCLRAEKDGAGCRSRELHH